MVWLQAKLSTCCVSSGRHFKNWCLRMLTHDTAAGTHLHKAYTRLTECTPQIKALLDNHDPETSPSAAVPVPSHHVFFSALHMTC